MNKLPRLALGTVQLGVPYGIANTTGMPSEQDAVDLLCAAIKAGISTIDTARAYGDAERRIGLALRDIASATVTIVTKLDVLADIPAGDAPAAVRAAEESLERSRGMLGRARLDAVLLHRASHRTCWGGAVWQTLLTQRDEGRIGEIGVSVQSPSEAIAALHDPAVARIQLPFNILDHRWLESGVIEALLDRPHVIVDVRSVLLQGLLADAPPHRWPHIADFSPQSAIDRIRALADRFGYTGTSDFALAFVRGQSWIDNIVVGIENRAQLDQNLGFFRHEPLHRNAIAETTRAIPRAPVELLDPSLWKLSTAAG